MADDVRKPMTIDIPEDDDVVVKTTGTPDKAEKKTSAPASADEGIEELAQQLKASKDREAEARRRAATEAEEARKAKEEVERSRGEVVDTQLNATDSAIAAKTSERERARIAFKQAAESGNYDDMAKLQEHMADLAADLSGLKKEKELIQTRITAHEAARQAGAHEGRVQPRSSGDPVQDFIANMQPGKSRAWVELNKDRLDHNTLRRLGHTHDDALMDGVAFESQEYFDRLEERLDGLTGRKKVEVQEDAPRRSAAKEAASFSAPVSREGSSYTASRHARRITLTPEQQEAADISGISYEQYAKNLLAIRSKGDS